MESPKYSQENEKMRQEPLVAMDTPKGGFRTIPFILVNEAFERVASYGLTPNMILYLMNEYHLELATGNNILLYWSAATNFLPVVGAFLADSFVGRFWMIGFGSIFSLLGMILLWSTTIIPQARPPPCMDSGITCSSSQASQLMLLCSSFGLMSIGAGGIRASSAVFGANQLVEHDNMQSTGVLERYLNWYNAASSLSVVIALTFIVYIQDHLGWEIGFGVPVVLMFLSALSFFLASPFYVKLKPKSSLLTGIFQVIVATYKNRHLTLLSDNADALYHHKKESVMTVPSNKLRFLNKACIVRDDQQELLTNDKHTTKSWSVCTVDQVEELKCLLAVIPLWFSGAILCINISQPSFGVLQATSMDRHITSNFEFPAGSFGMLTVLSIALWVALYYRIIIPIASKIMKKPAHLTTIQRMGLGIFVSFLSMATSAIVERIRRNRAIQEGYVDEPEKVIQMSAMWLVPQHCLSGFAEGLSAVAQFEFYISEFPGSMSSISTSLYTVGLALANLLASSLFNMVDQVTKGGGNTSWVSSNINQGHYDYYYWLLAGLSLVNLMYFLVCSSAYGPLKGQDKAVMVTDDIGDELLVSR